MVWLNCLDRVDCKDLWGALQGLTRTSHCTFVVGHFSSNLQPIFSNTGKPVNKVTQSLKKREDKRRDRKTSTSSINSVESSQRADSRASLSSRPSSRSDVSPDGKTV